MLFAGLASGSAAVSAPGHDQRRCEVVDAGRLPSGVGAEVLCQEVERAIGAAAPKGQYHAQIHVLSPSRLSALLTVDGRNLPEQNFAVMDRELSSSSIRHFAEALAAEVAKASKE